MELQLLSQAKTHSVYRDGETAVKIYDADYPKGEVFAEALNQARIEDIGILAPKVYGVNHIDGKWAIKMQYIEGDNLQKVIDSNPDKEDEYLKLFVNLHMGVYAYKLPTLYKLIDKTNTAISRSGLKATVQYDLHTRLDDRHKHTRVCHGNFIPANVKVGKDGKFYIFDWSKTAQGDPTIDIATTYLLLKLDGRADFAEKYLDMMDEKSVYSKENVLKWIPVVAAGKLSTCRADEKAALLELVGAK